MTIRSTGELESKTLNELVDIYNSVSPSSNIKKFRDKETGIRRTLEALSRSQSKMKTRREMKKVRVLKGSSAPFTPMGEGPGPRKRKVCYPRKETIIPYQDGTKRSVVISMLSSGGATVQEVMDEIGWDKPTAMEGIRLLHRKLGYGLKELDNGKIILITEHEQDVE